MSVRTPEEYALTEKEYATETGRLLKLMRSDILEPKTREGSIRNSGGKRIPAIKSMKLEIGRINEILLAIGIKKRLGAEIRFKTTAANQCNIYMEKQIQRLIKLRDEGKNKEYGELSYFLLHNSRSFRVSAFNRVFANGGYAMSMTTVTQILKGVEKIIGEKSTDLIYRRVYIPKDGNTYRPLGVPEGPGRVVGHMINNFITLFMRKEVETFNHGFIPGKGTMTAIKQIVAEGLDPNNKYIYEFDLRKFFNNVNIDQVTLMLKNRGMPYGMSKGIEDINRRNPKLADKDLIDESGVRNKAALEEVLNSSRPTTETIKELLVAVNRNFAERQIMAQLSGEGGTPELGGVMAAYLSLMTNPDYVNSMPRGALDEVSDNMKKLIRDTFFKGLPQGLNTSPILSITTLIPGIDELKEKGIKAVMYADDGYLISEQPFEPFGPEGILINESKSKGIKKDGKFLSKSKFLGIDIDFINDTGEGKTRSGKVTKMKEEIYELIKDLEKYKDERTNLEYITNSGLLGYVQSRLYNGEGEEIQGVITEWNAQETSGVARNLKKTLQRVGINLLKYKKSDNDLFGINFKGSPTKSSEACNGLLSVMDRINGKGMSK